MDSFCGTGRLFFVRVNQVLVRLWAQRGRMSDRQQLAGAAAVFRGVMCDVLSKPLCAGDIRCGWFLCMVGWIRASGSVDLERDKGIWWMPWHQEAMKDVARCEKPRGAASRL